MGRLGISMFRVDTLWPMSLQTAFIDLHINPFTNRILLERDMVWNIISWGMR
jgi:hypothetical protein